MLEYYTAMNRTKALKQHRVVDGELKDSKRARHQRTNDMGFHDRKRPGQVNPEKGVNFEVSRTGEGTKCLLTRTRLSIVAIESSGTV